MRALRLAAVVVLGMALACGRADRTPSTSSDSSAATPAAASTEPSLPPLPSFHGTTLDGHPFEASSLVGRRALLFAFNPDVPEAGPTADAVAAVAKLADANNFAVVGIALATNPSAAARFARQHDLKFPIVDDDSAQIADRLHLRAPVGVIVVDAGGYIGFAMPGFVTEGAHPESGVEVQLRQALRLPPMAEAAAPRLGSRPLAPDFHATRLRGGKSFELASLRGKPVVLIFFLYTCPHCHKALEFLHKALAQIPKADRPVLIGVSVSNQTLAIRETLERDGLDFFPVLLDPDRTIENTYGVLAGVPDIFLINRSGHVVARVQGWREDRDPPLMRMRLAKLAGRPVPMLLASKGYSGSEVCGVCHSLEYETWLLTRHSTAFDSLVRHGADLNPDCVRCHTVGFGKPAGYTIGMRDHTLEDVGCESCHGRGGPHLSPNFVHGNDYAPICRTCHDAKHSLGFEYAKFEPRIDHRANAHLATLPLAQKRRILAERARPRADLLPTQAAYVGSDACRSCHPKEYATWAKSPHAHAVQVLERKGKADDPTCLACHTTAFGLAGGFPKGGRPARHADLARVGCESCHGPGGNHVKPDAPKAGTIISLGDKCDTCVILQVCGRCHDQANDPGFKFHVKEKIEAQRHGTIQPRAAVEKTSELSPSWITAPTSAVVGTLERAFDAPGPSS